MTERALRRLPLTGAQTDVWYGQRLAPDSPVYNVGQYVEEGNGEWVVTIRCAEAEGRTLRLYAGAGVVSASVPEAETAETAAKFRTFLNAVGAKL